MKILCFAVVLIVSCGCTPSFSSQKRKSLGLDVDYLGRLALDNGETVDEIYSGARALMTDHEREFLEGIVAADDLILERQTRTIVDQFLSTLAGTNPALELIINAENQLPSNSSGSAANGTKTANQLIQETIKAHDNHLISQIVKVVGNTATLNVTGVIDDSLKIAK